MEPKSGVDKQKWIDLADQAFYRLKEIIDLAPTEDPKLLKAVETAFDRAYGKPTEKTEITGKDGGALKISVEELAEIKKMFPNAKNNV